MGLRLAKLRRAKQRVARAAKRKTELIEFKKRFIVPAMRSAMQWGEPGPLERETGPDDNQREFLSSLGEEVRNAGTG